MTDISPFQTVDPPLRTHFWVITAEQDGISVDPVIRMSGGQHTLNAAKSYVDDEIRHRHRGLVFSDWHFDDSRDVCRWDFWYRINAQRDFGYYVTDMVVTE